MLSGFFFYTVTERKNILRIMPILPFRSPVSAPPNWTSQAFHPKHLLDPKKFRVYL